MVISDIGSTDDTAIICNTNRFGNLTFRPGDDSILEETGLHQMGVELVIDVVVMFQDLIEIDILW